MIVFARKTTPALVATALILTGCERPEVSVYDVPKNESTSASIVRLTENLGSRRLLEWNVPEGWESLPRSALNRGNYVAKGPDGGKVEITVSSVPDASGELTRVINEYRRSIGLPKETVEEIDASAEKFEHRRLKARRYHLANEVSPNEDHVHLVALLADGYTWFFTMKGPAAAVSDQTKNFDSLIASITPSEELASQSVSEKADYEPTIQFTIPDDWRRGPDRVGRIASLAVEKPGLPAADLAVLRFKGNESIHLANLNRWRDQLGLEAWSQSQASALAKTQTIGGKEFTLYEFAHASEQDAVADQQGMIVAFLVQDNFSWVFKIRGDALLLDTQRKYFEQFLASVNFVDPVI